MYSFVHALTAFRLGAEPDCPADIRDFAIRLVQLYLERGTGNLALQKLSAIYEKVRQLAYLIVQENLGIRGIESAIFAPRSLEHIVLGDDILFEPFAQRNTPLGDLMEAVDHYHYETFFTGDEAGALVLVHLRQFRSWWKNQRDAGVELGARITNLFAEPDDWPKTGHNLSDQHLCVKLDVPVPDGRWIEEVRRWHGGGAPWPDSSFFLSLRPGSSIASCSIYAAESFVSRSVAHHVARNLSRLTKKSWNEDWTTDANARWLWRSVARFGQVLFKRTLDKKYYLQVQPTKASGRSIGFAVIGDDRDAIAARIRLFVSKSDAEPRVSELPKLADFVAWLPAQNDCYWLAFLAKTTVVRSKGYDEFQEVDGLVAEITRDTVRWHALEMKELHLTGAQAQLKHLAKALTVKTTAPATVASGPSRVSHCEWTSG